MRVAHSETRSTIWASPTSDRSENRRARGDERRLVETSNEDLMRYMDGEMPPDEAGRFEQVLHRSTELQRELALYRAMNRNLRSISFAPLAPGRSVWDRVNARLARPIGWILLVVGAALWAAYGGYIYFQSSINAWEKLATSAVIFGILMLFATVAWDRYRAWLVDPYKDVYR